MANGTVEVMHRHNGERLLEMLRRQHPEYHPIMSVARIAHACESEGEYELAYKAHAEVLKYVEPQLKPVEVRNHGEKDRVIEVCLFDDAKVLESVRAELPVLDVESVELTIVE